MLFDSSSVSSGFMMSSAVSWMWRKCRRFSRLFGLICILLLDFIGYVNQISDKVPQGLYVSSLTLISAVGLISLPFTLHYIHKTAVDFMFGLRASHIFVTILSVGKLVELVGILVLTIGSFAAESAAQFGHAGVQAVLYEYMTPLGEAAIILGIALLISYLWMDQRVINALDPQVFTVETEKTIIKAFQDPKSKENISLASEIRLCMDKDTLEHFLNTFQQIGSHSSARNQIFDVVRDNVIVQQKIALRGELLLVIAGYFCLGFQNYYTPNPIVSASMDLVLGSAYTIKVLIETIREVMQRKRMNRVVQDRHDTGKIQSHPLSTSTQELAC